MWRGKQIEKDLFIEKENTTKKLVVLEVAIV
jgi:hypothetical protein